LNSTRRVIGSSPSTNNGTSTSLVVQAGTSPSYTLGQGFTPLTGSGVTGSQGQKAYLRVYVTRNPAEVPFVNELSTDPPLRHSSYIPGAEPSVSGYPVTQHV